MIDPVHLEKAMLGLISSVRSDDWIDFPMGVLRNRLNQSESTLGLPSDSEVADCICSLEARSLIAVRKRNGNNFVNLMRSMLSEDQYRGQFFFIGSFELRLTHEGRKVVAHKGMEVANPAEGMDDLLPLYRRKVFDADLERAAKESHDLPFAIVMIDVDKFKKINDDHGHQMGDEVLRAVSAAISVRVRGKGKAYRYGGEEMAILLVNYSKMEASALAETIRIDLDRSQVTEKQLKVTASFGVASSPEDGPVGKQLLELSDNALRSAKALGRNLVRAVGDVEESRESRAAERKRPVLQALSDEQQAAIRMTHFRGQTPKCPKDGALLRVNEFQDMMAKTPTLMVTCPNCGIQEFLEGD